MGVLDIFLIGVALSMDAFAVAIGKGMSMRKIDLKYGLTMAVFFGGFQALMPVIGYFLSSLVEKYVSSFSHWICLVILTAIGINIIRESRGEEDDGDVYISWGEMTMLAIATSIDAMAVGVSFGTMGSRFGMNIFHAVALIGVTTFVITIIGIFIGKYFGNKYRKYAGIIGGIMLILIGIKEVVSYYLF